LNFKTLHCILYITNKGSLDFNMAKTIREALQEVGYVFTPFSDGEEQIAKNQQNIKAWRSLNGNSFFEAMNFKTDELNAPFDPNILK
jgi:hypothetical protein